MPASRSARAMIFAPRSCPSRPGFATTTRIFLPLFAPASMARASLPAGPPGPAATALLLDLDRHPHGLGVHGAVDVPGTGLLEPVLEGPGHHLFGLELALRVDDRVVVH